MLTQSVTNVNLKFVFVHVDKIKLKYNSGAQNIVQSLYIVWDLRTFDNVNQQQLTNQLN